ncbi:hypothetical protein VTO42DRAFT_3497 [Malbranchea cinnamomea]
MAAPQMPVSHTTTFLDQPPSCLEFCPAFPEHLVIGTYLLSQSEEDTSSSESTRTGSLQLFKLDPTSFNLTQEQRLSLKHAVFDLHFSPRDPSLFAVALSTAAVAIFRVESVEASNPQIRYLSTIPVHDDPAELALHLAWIPPSLEQADVHQRDGFAVSFSGGQVSVFHTNGASNELIRESMSEIQFPGSSIEVWYVAFNQTNPKGRGLPSLFSGDDFSQVREFVFPGLLNSSDDEDENASSPYQKFNDRGKHHGAGVTAILPLFTDESSTVLLTGSYDGYIRVYRLNMRGQVLEELDLGGGVWRLKLIKTTRKQAMSSDPPSPKGLDYYILASCMHAGTRILKLSHTYASDSSHEQWTFEVLTQFTEHESMNYASDFRIQLDNGITTDGTLLLCVSSSFYDKRVCVWNATI